MNILFLGFVPTVRSPICHSTCQTCSSASSSGCDSCDSTLNRVINGPTPTNCICSTGYGLPLAGDTCSLCDASCATCTNGNDANSCLTCAGTGSRTLSGTACPCTTIGYYSSGSSCPACQPTCDTCSDGTASGCITCVTGLNRQICSGATPCACSCITGYGTPAAGSACNLCHFSCQTCNIGNDANSCTACDSSNFRHLSVNSCLCDNGYYDNSVALCATCFATCQTCSGGTASTCSTCLAAQFRTLNGAAPTTCQCSSGYGLPSSGDVCIACDSTCATCTNGGSSTSCLTCDSATNHRTLSSSSCVCQNGYYENSVAVCPACNAKCLTCSGANDNQCLTCQPTQFRTLNGATPTNCKCNPTLGQPATGVICLACHYSCVNCNNANLANSCTSCLAANHRSLSGSSCNCQSTYYNTGVALCSSCTTTASPWCVNCNLVATNCTSCNGPTNKRTLQMPARICVCMAGFYDTGVITCAACNFRCATCNIANTNCTSCNSANFRSTLVSNTCPCNNNYYDNNVAPCQPCDSKCFQCTGPASTQCSTCWNTLPGTPSSFKTPSQCTTNCGAGWVSISWVCQLCDANCLTCSGTKIFCTSCHATPSQFWLPTNSNKCLSTCPANQYNQPATPGFCGNCFSSCLLCYLGSFNTCSSCKNGFFFDILTNSCPTVCLPGYYPESATNTCNMCDSKCTTCLTLSRCLTCIWTLTLLDQSCVSNCPAVVYFQKNIGTTFKCMLCQTNCIKISYFNYQLQYPEQYPTSVLLLKVNFTSQVDQATFRQMVIWKVDFPHNEVLIKNGNFFVVRFQPKNKIVLQNQPVANTTSVNILLFGVTGDPFSSTVWKLNTSFAYFFANISGGNLLTPYANKVRDYMDNIPLQVRLIPTFFLRSFQLTSSFIIIDFPLPKLYYDGLSILSSGNYYQVPSWQRKRNQSLSKNLLNLILSRRSLSEVPFRASRTSMDGIFHRDFSVYLIILIAVSLLTLAMWLLRKIDYIQSSTMSLVYQLYDATHQACFFFIFYSAGLAFFGFQRTLNGYISLSIACLSIVYFTGFYLNRFYSSLYMLDGFDQLNQVQLTTFLQRNAHAVRDYKIISQSKARWTFKPFIKSQFFGFLSGLKKSIMMFGLVCFLGNPVVQMSILFALQAFQLLRWLYIRPYQKWLLNVLRISIQVIVLVMIMLLGGSYFCWTKIVMGQQDYLQIYSIISWVLLVLTLIYCSYFLIFWLYSVYRSICPGSKELVIDCIKRQFYQVLRNHQSFEQKQLNNLSIGVGLYDGKIKDLPDIDVKFDWLQMIKCEAGISIITRGCFGLKMNPAFIFKKPNNTTQTKKYHGQFLIPQIPEEFREQFVNIMGNSERVEISSFVRVQQAFLKQNQNIPLVVQFQEIKKFYPLAKQTLTILRDDKLLRNVPLTKDHLFLLKRISIL